jgi:type III restriction enzyme
MHDYEPDFIVRLNGGAPVNLIVETKGYDPLKEIKRQAAERWVSAVNADGRYGRWRYVLIEKISDLPDALNGLA